LYAGGTVASEKLGALGISEKQVLDYLKEKIAQLDKTRLHENIQPVVDGDWQYEYSILKNYPEIFLTIGVEIIQYKGQTVFTHVFLNSPIL
jgi:hypothetical protein